MTDESYTVYEPLSLIPANGWQVAHSIYPQDGKGSLLARVVVAEPLVAFVVTRIFRMVVLGDGIEEKVYQSQEVLGYSDIGGAILPARDLIGFLGYLPPGKPIPGWMEQAARGYVGKDAKGD